MTVSRDNNISVKEYDKTNKHKDLEIQIEKMLNLKTITMAVIVGALGMIKKGTDKHINNIPVSPSLYEIQKIALFRTAYLLRRVLSMWQKNITQKRQQKNINSKKTYNHYIPSA